MQLHQPQEKILDAQQAIDLLKGGNARYVQAKLSDKSTYSEDRKALTNGQNPFAVVICCSDSRVAPEVFFDQKLGDIFVIRNAGNVVDDVVMGSIEYAVEGLRCPVVVVCGHSCCGAVTACCHGGHDNLPHLGSIMELIQPALEVGHDVEAVSHKNVENMVNEIKAAEIVKHMNAAVVGAYYDICTGEVSWL